MGKPDRAQQRFDSDRERDREPIRGDYTKERRETFADLEIEELLALIRREETGTSGEGD